MPFDVLIPTFNAPAARLGRAVRGSLACGASRIVIVDDGSPTPVDLGALGVPTERLRLVRQPNAGVSAARNRGFAECGADWVLLLDDDDELVPEGVAAMVELGGRLNAAAVQGGRIELRPGGERKVYDIPAEFADRAIPEPDDVFMPIALFGASGLFVSRRVIEAGVRFDEGISVQEDRDFLSRAGRVGPVCISSTPALLIHRDDGPRAGAAMNLTSTANFARRVRDHVVLLDRHCPIGGGPTARAREHWRKHTVWLVNNAAKAGIGGELLGSLMVAARERGWGVPIKARVRAAIRSVFQPSGAKP